MHLVFKLQEVTIWNMNETYMHTLCTWRNATMGSQVLVKLRAIDILDKCEVTISYRKYTQIYNKIN